jgi:hypothetical protein
MTSLASISFRTGNVSPAKDNLDFIKISQDALPKGTKFTDSSADTKAYTAYDTKAKTYRHMNFFEHSPPQVYTQVFSRSIIH